MLSPKPTTSESIAGKLATIETPNQAEFPAPEINQLATGVSDVPVSNDHTQASTAVDNFLSDYAAEMAEVDAEGDPGAAKQSWTHTAEGDDEYFEVEAIKSCKLNSRVRRFSAFFIFLSNYSSLLLGGGPLGSQVEGL
jgi:hypothetical protein